MKIEIEISSDAYSYLVMLRQTLNNATMQDVNMKQMIDLLCVFHYENIKKMKEKKDVVVRVHDDGFIKISQDENGILKQPAGWLKQLFGEIAMRDTFYDFKKERAKKRKSLSYLK